MKILITGGSGFVGTHLSLFLLERGHRVISVNSPRSRKKGLAKHENLTHIQADTSEKGNWLQSVADADAVINLAGRTVFKRWDERYKKSIYDSRILTTQNLAQAIPENRDFTFISASAVGFYGSRGEESITEDTPAGNDFLAGVAVDWEAAATAAAGKVRVVTPRFGVVLERSGGAMAKMLPAFNLFMGGPVGSGSQWFPWIHMRDLLEGMRFILEEPKISGPVNFVSEQQVRNGNFAKTLGGILGRPSALAVPGFMIRAALGEFGETLLSSQRVVPDKLRRYGFRHRYPEAYGALAEIAGKA